MKLSEVKNKEGLVVLEQVKNRYDTTEYIVDILIKGQEHKRYTYKKFDSAIKKYKKVTMEMVKIYIEKCNRINTTSFDFITTH